MNSREDIKSIAQQYRSVIELLCASNNASVLDVTRAIRAVNPCAPSSFPHNWCNFTTCALGNYLLPRLQLRPVLELVDATLVAGGQHYWLRINDIDIDISADQFGGPEIVVEHRSIWHQEHFYDHSSRPFSARRPFLEATEHAICSLSNAASRSMALRCS